MFTATLWVRGPDDINWRLNANFHRPSWPLALQRVQVEVNWYNDKGYRTFVGPDKPELDVP